LEEQAKYLPTLTDGIVAAEVKEISSIEAYTRDSLPLNVDFNYRFQLIGKFVKEYRFKVMSFSHDITLYPVSFKVDSEIGKELKLGDGPVLVETPEKLEEFVRSVLTSQRLRTVVGSIMRLSK